MYWNFRDNPNFVGVQLKGEEKGGGGVVAKLTAGRFDFPLQKDTRLLFFRILVLVAYEAHAIPEQKMLLWYCAYFCSKLVQKPK